MQGEAAPLDTQSSANEPSARRGSTSQRAATFCILLLAAAICGAWAYYVGTSTARFGIPVVELATLEPDVAADIRQAQEALRGDRSSSAAWSRYGYVLVAHDFFVEAGDCFKQAAELDGRDARWPYLRGVCLERVDPSSAIASFRQALAIDPNLLEPAWKLADLYLVTGQLELAERELRTAYAADPAHPRTTLGLAQVAYRTGQYDDALGWAQRALAVAPRRRDIRELLCRIHEQRGDRQAADLELEIVQALPQPRRAAEWDDPFLVEIARYKRGKEWSLLLAQELIAQGRFDEAMQRLDSLGWTSSDDVKIVVMAGKTQLHRGDLDLAESTLQRARKLDERYAPVHFELGNLALVRGRFSEGAAHYKTAVVLQPHFPEAHANLATCFVELNQHATAILFLEVSCRQMPSNPRTHLELARLLTATGRHAEAAKHEAAAKRFAAILGESPNER